MQTFRARFSSSTNLSTSFVLPLCQFPLLIVTLALLSSNECIQWNIFTSGKTRETKRPRLLVLAHKPNTSRQKLANVLCSGTQPLGVTIWRFRAMFYGQCTVTAAPVLSICDKVILIALDRRSHSYVIRIHVFTFSLLGATISQALGLLKII